MAEQVCLHCAIRDAVLDYFEGLGHLHGDVIVTDCHEVVRSIARITAEHLAAFEDENERSRALTYLMRRIIEDVNDIRAKGEQAETLRSS